MENEEKVMTGEESLKIISKMINKTKFDIRQGSFYLLFWGWVIFACSLSEFLIRKFTTLNHSYYVWFLVVPAVLVSLIYGFIKGRKASVTTYTGNLYKWIWLGFMISATVLFIVHSKSMYSVAPYILLLAGLPTFFSGFLIKFKPLIAGGLCFWAIALVIYFAGPSSYSLGSAIAMLLGYLIPGYMLKNRVDHDAV
ncbi:MAG: hypothetical protein ABSA76_02670 [Bacteroidales bacterium]